MGWCAAVGVGASHGAHGWDLCPNNMPPCLCWATTKFACIPCVHSPKQHCMGVGGGLGKCGVCMTSVHDMVAGRWPEAKLFAPHCQGTDWCFFWLGLHAICKALGPSGPKLHLASPIFNKRPWLLVGGTLVLVAMHQPTRNLSFGAQSMGTTSCKP